MSAATPARKGIKDVFYETRALTGRDYTLRRFAAEVLGGSVDPVMLGYIEKGKRFPSEALVRRLAAVRQQDAHELLALLSRDRMLYAFGRELRRPPALSVGAGAWSARARASSPSASPAAVAAAPAPSSRIPARRAVGRG